MRRSGLPVLTVPLITSCGANQPSADACFRRARMEEDQLQVHPVDVAPVPEGQANVILNLTSHARRVERLRITFDAVQALDVELPDSLGCEHPPVFTFGFDVPEDTLDVRVSAGDDVLEERLEVPREGTRWLVVSTDDGFPLRASVMDELPQFG